MPSLIETFYDADGRLLADAACFAVSFALCAGSLHLAMLNSRVAIAAMPWAAAAGICALAVAVAMGARSGHGRGPSLVCLAVYAASLAAFAASYLPTLRMLFFVTLSASALVLVLCDAIRLMEAGPRVAALGLSFGSLFGAAALLAVSRLGAAVGLGHNVANYTMYCMCIYIALSCAGAALHVVAQRRTESGQRDAQADPAEKPAVVRTVGRPRATIDVETVDGEDGSPGAQPPSRSAGQSWLLPEKRLGPLLGADAPVIVTMLVLLLGAATTAFFDGFSFNPFQHDVMRIDAVRFLLVALGSFALLATANRVEADRSMQVGVKASAASLCLGVLGIALLSQQMSQAPQVGAALASAAHSMLLLCGLSLASMFGADGEHGEHVRAACAACVIACCESPTFISMGIGARHALGYDINMLTPLVIASIAALALCALAASAHMMDTISLLRDSYSEQLALSHQESLEQRKEKALDRIVGQTKLSSREREAALLAIVGATNKEIALKMGISEKTVAFHLGNFYRKANLAGKAELTRLGRENGLDR